MMKGLVVQQQSVVEENMSNITSASGEASVSSGNRAESGSIYPNSQQDFASPNQTQPVKRKRNLPGNPAPDAEVIALSPKALLATNRFVCEICNKGFQRDQNLQLHRRGHNLPWKLKQRNNKDVRKKVYVCPEASCVHHDPSRALGDLTGIKKHFCRKHGEKKWKCDKCSKSYAVQTDWKAHSKNCGTREYRCDCGILFSRRDSFITHRAFCDALAEESVRTIAGNNSKFPSQAGTSTSNMNLQVQSQINSRNLYPFAMKKEDSNFSLRPENPPWLPCPPIIGAVLGPPPIDLISSSSSTSIFSTRLNQELSQNQGLSLHEIPNPSPNLGATLHPYHPTASPHMSATALLQKAAQMSAAMFNKAIPSPSQSTIKVPHQAHVSSDDSGNFTTSFGLILSPREGTASGYVQGLTSYGNKAAVPSGDFTDNISPSTTGTGTGTGIGTAAPADVGTGAPSSQLLHDMMTSLTSTNRIDGSSAFEDAFGGMLNSKKDVFSKIMTDHNFGRTDERGGVGNGKNDSMTRDFLGLRPLSQSDIINIDSLSNCINTPNKHPNQVHKLWQG